MACWHPQLVSCVSWMPTPLLRACFVGTTCKLHDVMHKSLEAMAGDNITPHCWNGGSQFSWAGGRIWQWELKEEMIKWSFSTGSLTVLTWKFTLASNSEIYLAMTQWHRNLFFSWNERLVLELWSSRNTRSLIKSRSCFLNVKVHSSSCCHFIFHRQWVKLLSEPRTDTGS